MASINSGAMSICGKWRKVGPRQTTINGAVKKIGSGSKTVVFASKTIDFEAFPIVEIGYRTNLQKANKMARVIDD